MATQVDSTEDVDYPERQAPPLRVRLALGGLIWFFGLLAILTVVGPRYPTTRLVGAVVLGVVALAYSWVLKLPTEPDQPVPTYALTHNQAADLVKHTLDRADRNGVAWLTITVTVHSLVFLALSRMNPVTSLDDIIARVGLIGLSLLVLSSVTLSAAYYVASSIEHARRAIVVAGNKHQVFPYVYIDAPGKWTQATLPIVLYGFGFMWLSSGLLLVYTTVILNAV